MQFTKLTNREYEQALRRAEQADRRWPNLRVREWLEKHTAQVAGEAAYWILTAEDSKNVFIH